MKRFALSAAMGPVQIIKEDGQYVAYWNDSLAGRVSQTLEKKWNHWLEAHYSMDPLTGMGSVFLPPEALIAHPLWERKAIEILKNAFEAMEKVTKGLADG